MYGDAEVFELSIVRRIKGSLGLCSSLNESHHVMTFVIIDGEPPAVAVLSHLFEQPL